MRSKNKVALAVKLSIYSHEKFVLLKINFVMISSSFQCESISLKFDGTCTCIIFVHGG